MKKSISIFLIVCALFSVLISCDNNNSNTSLQDPTSEELNGYLFEQLAINKLVDTTNSSTYNQTSKIDDFLQGQDETLTITYTKASTIVYKFDDKINLVDVTLDGKAVFTKQGSEDIKVSSNISVTYTYKDDTKTINLEEEGTVINGINSIKVNGDPRNPQKFQKYFQNIFE